MTEEPTFEIDTEDVEEINKDNFAEYFFDARKHGPKSGQILAKFKAAAIFGHGPEKFHLIQALKMGKAKEAAQVMRKLHLSREPDCYRVCKEMSKDLLDGMTEKEVAEKGYHYVLEAFYYTKKEYVPKDDPHWETIRLIKFDPETGTFKCDIEI